MTDQQHARVIRNSAGLIIEDIDYEPVATEPHMGCDGCVFDDEEPPRADCCAHACLQCHFPADHPLHLRRAIWVRKT